MNHLLLYVTGLLATCVSIRAQTVLTQYPVTTAVGLVGDHDGDGLRDLMWGVSSGPVNFMSSRTSGLLLQLFPTAPQIALGQCVGLDDVDGDGRDEILMKTQTSPFGQSNHVQVASGATGAILYTSSNLTFYSYMASLGDINGNGTGDFAFGDVVATFGGIAEAGQVEVVDGGTWSTIRVHGGWFFQHWFGDVRALGDVNGDGAGDYTVRSITGLNSYSGATGQPLFTIPLQSNTFAEYLLPIGDFNADGFGDFAISDRDSPPWTDTYRSVSVFGGPTGALLWSHTYTFTNPGPVLFGNPTRAAVGDIDNDGHADAPFYGGLTGTNLTVVSGHNQAFVREYPMAVSPGITAVVFGSPGDFDGDGTPDLLRTLYSGSTPIGAQLISGQAPGVTAFGTGCPSTTGAAPKIGIGVGARLGRTMSVNLSLAPTSTALAILGIGFSNTSWVGGPLPFDLAPFGLPGCPLLVAPDILVQMATAGQNGTLHHASHPVAIPSNTQLLGIGLFCQWLVLESTPAVAWGSVSSALRAIVVP